MQGAIQVVTEVGSSGQPSKMVASSLGARTIERMLDDLPSGQPAKALALLMCHHNKWDACLVAGVLPNGDEVFCFRDNRS